MADDIDDINDEHENGDGAKKRRGKGKLIGVIVGGLSVVVLIGGAIGFSMGVFDSMLDIERANQSVQLKLSKPIVHTLPDIAADLKTGKCKSTFLRAVIGVELSAEDLPRLESSLTKIMDGILTHLRDQERENFVGKAGAEQLRFDLLSIVNKNIQPARAHAILFNKLILQ
jgi:flagellar basal body-associated protein FliL